MATLNPGQRLLRWFLGEVFSLDWTTMQAVMKGAYPQALRSGGIPLPARIFAVVAPELHAAMGDQEVATLQPPARSPAQALFRGLDPFWMAC